MPLHGMLIAEAQRRIARGATAKGSGSEQLVNYFVGQIVGSMNQVKSARQVVMDMVEEYIETMDRLNAQMQAG